MSHAAEEEKAALIPEEEVATTAGEEKKVMMMMKVMVAVDESDVSVYTLKWAIDHLFKHNSVAGAGGATTAELGMESQQYCHRVMIVHVMQPFQSYVFPAGPSVYATNTVVESVKKAQEENAASVLSRAMQICEENMIRAETLILEGDPEDMICQAAEKMNIDLLIVGSRGLGRIKRAFLGSVSDYCAHHAKCPILIVKPPKEPRKGSNTD